MWISYYSPPEIGKVTKHEHAIAIFVAKSYRPCPPTTVHATIPTVMLTLLNAISGKRSRSMRWMVVSLVRIDGNV
jgi:hypothetical protein